MRCLRITMYSSREFTLPIAYHELQHGLLYRCWHENFPELHDSYADDGAAFRPFVFGRLEGKGKANGAKKLITFFPGSLYFEVRSPYEELMDELAAQLASRGTVELGPHELQLVNLQAADRLLFPGRAKIRLSSAVVARRTLDDGHTFYFSPEDREWLEMIQGNAARKADLLGLDVDPTLFVLPYHETLRKRVTRFKGTYITGWTGDFLVSGAPQLLAALWCCGLGEKNSQGFGLFDFIDEPC